MKSWNIVTSFQNAWRGLRLGFRTERSFRLQTAAALIVVAVIIALPLSLAERLAMLIVMMVVLVLELLNSSLERLVDLAKPRFDAYAADVKDLMAGAVLLASFFAALVGFLILKPYLISLLVSL